MSLLLHFSNTFLINQEISYLDFKNHAERDLNDEKKGETRPICLDNPYDQIETTVLEYKNFRKSVIGWLFVGSALLGVNLLCKKDLSKLISSIWIISGVYQVCKNFAKSPLIRSSGGVYFLSIVMGVGGVVYSNGKLDTGKIVSLVGVILHLFQLKYANSLLSQVYQIQDKRKEFYTWVKTVEYLEAKLKDCDRLREFEFISPSEKGVGYLYRLHLALKRATHLHEKKFAVLRLMEVLAHRWDKDGKALRLKEFEAIETYFFNQWAFERSQKATTALKDAITELRSKKKQSSLFSIARLQQGIFPNSSFFLYIQEYMQVDEIASHVCSGIENYLNNLENGEITAEAVIIDQNTQDKIFHLFIEKVCQTLKTSQIELNEIPETHEFFKLIQMEKELFLKKCL